jgi:phage replication initiation protein
MKANNILFDWLSFSALYTNDPTTVITDILKLDETLFVEQGYGVNGYKGCLYYDTIRVYYNGREGTQDIFGGGNEFMGVFVSMSGSACRQYELLGGDMLSLIRDVYNRDKMNLTRIDIACDDKQGALDMAVMREYYQAKGIRSSCRKRKFVSEDDGNKETGCTLYIGSSKSDLFFRIYDKAKEQYNPKTHPDEYNAHWLRLEMVLRHDNAKNAVKHIFSNMDDGKEFGECVAEMVNGHLQFIEHDDSNISRCSIAEWWAAFLETINQVKVTIADEVLHVYEKKLQWFFRSIAPSAYTLLKGMGEIPFLQLLAVAKQRQNANQAKMLEVYQNDVVPKSIGVILGREFRRQIEKLHYHPFTMTAWREMQSIGKPKTERTLTSAMLDIPKIPNKDWAAFLDEPRGVQLAI